ncbi:MAG: RluA family pseudouridine synthase [Bacteroidales bacterium]|nr:RluA family pseudouridine synthase [Bacteroidales bacterium]
MQEDQLESQELYEHYRFEADAGQSILRLDKFLVNKLESTSRSRIQTAAQAGNILVNGLAVKPNYKVKPLDTISIVLPQPSRQLKLIPEDIPIEIVYEDESLLVVNKQPGMVVHPGHGNYSGTLINALMFHLKDNPLFQTGEERPGLVHRIDKDTSGLLVVAKNELAMNKLASQFFNKTSKRTYQALVWGNLDEDEGTIEGNIGRYPKNRKKMWVFEDGSEGKHAITHYKILERFDYVNLVECRLETGRTHQIRVHFQYIKHPIFNDMEYGGDQILRGTVFTKYKQFIQNCFQILPRQALHAKTLGFVHPLTGKEITFDTDLPNDMQSVLEKWRRYTGGREDG